MTKITTSFFIYYKTGAQCLRKKATTIEKPPMGKVTNGVKSKPAVVCGD